MYNIEEITLVFFFFFFGIHEIFLGNRNYWNNYTKKLPYGRTRANDSSRQYTRIVQKQKKEMHKRIPTPRSNVHTAYTPMTQPSTWNSMLDPNGFTIQLLRYKINKKIRKRNFDHLHVFFHLTDSQCYFTLQH